MRDNMSGHRFSVCYLAATVMLSVSGIAISQVTDADGVEWTIVHQDEQATWWLNQNAFYLKNDLQGLTVILRIEWSQPRELPSDAIAASDRTSNAYSVAKAYLTTDCDSMRLIGGKTQFLDAAGQTIGYHVQNGVMATSEPLQSAFVRACTLTSDEHPFRVAAGYRLAGRSRQDRVEIHLPSRKVKWPIVEAWQVFTYAETRQLPTTESVARSERTLEQFDCERKSSRGLQATYFDGPFARGNVVDSADFDQSEGAQWRRAAPGTIAEAIIDAACSGLQTPRPKQRPKPPAKPPTEKV